MPFLPSIMFQTESARKINQSSLQVFSSHQPYFENVKHLPLLKKNIYIYVYTGCFEKNETHINAKVIQILTE